MVMQLMPIATFALAVTWVYLIARELVFLLEVCIAVLVSCSDLSAG
jgi:hypothetical protein